MKNDLELQSSWRERLGAWIAQSRMQNIIMALILINAVVLGLETSDYMMQQWGWLLVAVDTFILTIFVIEIGLRFVAHGRRLLRDPWGLFDTLVILIALIPASGPLAVLRALRVLRVLRLVTIVPSMKIVVQSLLTSLPGLGSIIALLSLIFYVAAVIATQLFGDAFPEWFGTLGASLYSLFQIMTLESWSMGIVRPVMEVYPYAWLYFIPFILIATFMMLNLFIAVIVDAIQTQRELIAASKMAKEGKTLTPEHAEDPHHSSLSGTNQQLLMQEVQEMRAELKELRTLLRDR